MNIAWNLIKIGLMVTLIASCDERKSTDYEDRPSRDKTDLRLSDLRFYRLPFGNVAPRLAVISQGKISPSVAKSELSDTADMVFSDLTHLNQFGGQYSYGHFILTDANTIVGYSFLPTDEDAHDGIPIVKDGSKLRDQPRISVSFGVYDPWSDVVRDAGSIGNLGRLASIHSVEFVDFGFASFAKGIWSNLSDMSESGALRGLCVFRGDDFLAVRADDVLPNILGLALHLDDIDKLNEIGMAFPNLRFLVLSVAGRDEINKIFGHDLLRKYFPNLRGLMMAPVYWYFSELDMDPRGRDAEATLRLNPNRVPKRMQWLCIDGKLLSNHDAIRYNSFGRSLRYGSGIPVFKEGPINDVSVVYIGFGFSSSMGARSMHPWEYPELENLWRDSR